MPMDAIVDFTAECIRCVQIQFLEMHSLLLVHCRMRSRAYTVFSVSFFNYPNIEHLHDIVLHSWLVYRSVLLCRKVGINMLRSIHFSFSRKHEHQRFQSLKSIYHCLHPVYRTLSTQQHSCPHTVTSEQCQSMANRTTPSGCAE